MLHADIDNLIMKYMVQQKKMAQKYTLVISENANIFWFSQKEKRFTADEQTLR